MAKICNILSKLYCLDESVGFYFHDITFISELNRVTKKENIYDEVVHNGLLADI